jgi:hypothetical protein
MLDAPRIYRPVSALADYTEIIGHWHVPVAERVRHKYPRPLAAAGS